MSEIGWPMVTAGVAEVVNEWDTNVNSFSSPQAPDVARLLASPL